jgi:MoaA/NifB/PqqE/SkfB family radical SAM enzyme
MPSTLSPSKLYRLPWSLNDNVLAWLEPTKRCNLYCEGCYSRNDPKSDKSIDQVRADIELLIANRNVDSISIAGGDPLVYPHIVEVVRMIREDYDLKPVINTNALALDRGWVRRLHEVGLHGFTFHIDSTQGRPGWKDKTETELCELRLRYAEMVASIGDMSVAFNSTVMPNTLDEVPALMEWAEKHIDIVHSMVFILFRTTRSWEFDYYADGKPVKLDDLVYYDQDKCRTPLEARDVVAKIRERHPEFEPCAYLGGTVDPNSFKWLLSARLGSPGKTYGYIGPRAMELTQTVHHATAGKYLAYSSGAMLRAGRSMMASMSAVDAGVRGAARNYLREHRLPTTPVHFQSIVVIQPIDMMADGQANMCDGCPDMTVHDGKLVWSCRLDEQAANGCFLNAVPKKRVALPLAAEE